MRAKVSVVIPFYNGDRQLINAVKSVQKQTWKNLEVIIVDDGSTLIESGRVLERIKNLDPRVKVIKLEKNKGLSHARNTGWKHSSGKFVFFLDHDDWIDSKMLASMIESIPKAKNARFFAYCDSKLEGEKNRIRISNFEPLSQLFINRIPYAIFVPRKTIFEIGGYNENMVKGLEDWEYNLRLIKNAYLPIRVHKPFFHYKISSQGMLNSTTMKSFSGAHKQIREINPELYKFNHLLQLAKLQISEIGISSLFFPLCIWISLRLLPPIIFNWIIRRALKLKS